MKMKRLILVVSILLLVACSSNKIPEGFDESKLNDQAESIVMLLNDAQYSEVYDMFRTDIKALVTLEQIEQVLTSKYEQVGEFKKISQIAITDTKDPSTSEIFAVVIIVSEHEEGNATYTLSFDEALEIVGFYIK
jgi:hypothetical protein